MRRRPQRALTSWRCKGCTNVCYRSLHGETFEYCKPTLEGRVRHEWVTDDHISCLDYTTDPAVTETEVKIWGIS